MTENEFLAKVRETCRWMGLAVYHTHRSDRSEPGFPDLVIVGSNAIMFRELKTDKGKVTPPQIYWLGILEDLGLDVGVWRPQDFQMILKELATLGKLKVRQPMRTRKTLRTSGTRTVPPVS